MDNQKHIPVKKKIIHDMGDVEVRCPLCNILLFDSFGGGYSKLFDSGVFNPSDSKFCPNCGVKFIN